MKVSRAGFYAWVKRKPSQRQRDEMVLLAHIRSQFEASLRSYGRPRMVEELREQGFAIGHTRVGRLMRENGLSAIRTRKARRYHSFTPTPGLIHHSDRGSQYCATDYQILLKHHYIKISMSGKGNCYDNAPVESFFKTLKSELVWRTKLETRYQAERVIMNYINLFYNVKRRHSALGNISPMQYEKIAA